MNVNWIKVLKIGGPALSLVGALLGEIVKANQMSQIEAKVYEKVLQEVMQSIKQGEVI